MVYVNDSIDIFVEEIEKHIGFWNDKMLPTLIQFYNYCIAPEIVRDNIGKGKNCTDPPYILEAIKPRKEKKKIPQEIKIIVYANTLAM